MTEGATFFSWDDNIIGASDAVSDISSTEENYVFDVIGQQENLERPSEAHLRQQVIRMLVHDYRISLKDIAVDFVVHINGQRKRLDIAVFNPDEPHVESSLSRIVVYR